ncbi:MAG: hypothetical protein ACR2RV_20680 [Verrucomicrobiales bacterium]
MAISFLPIILMFLSASGGVSELLDLTDPRSYLEGQGVEYRLESLLEVLAEPATEEVNQVKAQEVKKLLAMRALGSLGDQAAIPALEKAGESEALFFDSYSNAAIAAIKGEAYSVPAISPEVLQQDLALLPEGIGLVLQARLDARGRMDLKKVIGEAFKSVAEGPDPAEMLTQINTQIGQIAGKIGNVRLDAVTLGLSEDVGDAEGFVIIIGRGQYDHGALEGFLSEQQRTEHHDIDGTTFIGLDGNSMAIAPLSHEMLILVGGPGWEHLPLAALAGRLKDRPAEPVFGARLRKVIERANQDGVLWGGGLISPGMKKAPPLAPFDEVVLSTRELEGEAQTQLTLEALGSEPQAVADKMAEMKQMVEQGIAEMEQRPQPGMQPILKIMKGLRFYAMGLNATVSAKLDGNPANIFSMVVPLFGVRNAVEPAQPARRVAPAQPEP